MNVAPILIVEDSSATRRMMREALLSEGYTVLEAEDGASALEVLASQAPALVLLDCQLPDMDSFEVGRRLLALVPGLPVIAVAGWMQSDETRVLAAGFLDVLVKPVNPARLVEVVQRHLAHASPEPSHSGKSVLIVDDDPTQRKLAQLALASAGLDVTVAESGEAALELAARLKPDVILSDVMMPGMDGFALCRAIRGDSSLARVPVVLMSAHYLEGEDRELAARFGADRYVSRTGGFGVVVRAVTEVIDSPGAELLSLPAHDLQAEHLRRIAHQLERQAKIGVGFARRSSLQATALSVLDSLLESLARQANPESGLDDTLAKCLDAAGVSVGAILLCGESGRLTLRAQVGSKEERNWDTYSELLLRAVKQDSLTLPSAETGPAGTELLAALGAVSTLVVPITARDETLGVLLLASNGADFAGTEGVSAVRTARLVSRQLGQALALSRTFSKLASAEQRYRALFENARDAIGVLSPDGVILEANGAWEKLLGAPRAELVGRKISDFAPEDGPSGKTEYDKAIGQEEGPVLPMPFRRAGGSTVQVELSRTVVEVGGERYVLGIGRDVSERVRLEEQLRQAQKMEAVGKLAGGVAHDFNNALCVILSYGEILVGNPELGEPMRDDVEQIRKAAKRASELTRQLLMFSRQRVIEPKVLDLNEMLSSVDKMLRRILGADVDLVLLLAQRLGRVRVDPGGIEQVIMNLVVNARDAMPTGGQLTLETDNVVLDEEYVRKHHGMKAGPHVMLAVTDSGSGMDKATQARIFEPFFTTKLAGKGTGLGLSTVFGIVQQSGGSVWVYSELGRGTTFKVYLPRVQAALDSILPVQATPLSSRGTETILLVEDDEQVRMVALGVLRRNGYHVLEACDATEALRHSEQHAGAIDLLLTDVVMPRVSGPELAKQLATLRPNMRVLCMSGYTDDSIFRHGVLASDIAYVQKPFTPALLTAKVREVLDAKRASIRSA